MNKIPPNAVFLGDGAYVYHDGYSFVVFTYDGMKILNQVYLEPYMVDKLKEFSDELYKPKRKIIED